MNPLFLEVHVHIVFFQHPSVLQAVEGVSCEAGNGFGYDHVDLTLLAVAHELVEVISLLDACSGDTFIGCCTERTNKFTPYRIPGARFPAEL